MGIVLVPSVPGRLHFEPGPDKLLWMAYLCSLGGPLAVPSSSHAE